MSDTKVSPRSMEAAQVAKIIKDLMSGAEDAIVSMVALRKEGGDEVKFDRPRAHPSFMDSTAALQRVEQFMDRLLSGDRFVPDKNPLIRFSNGSGVVCDISLESIHQSALGDDGVLILPYGQAQANVGERAALDLKYSARFALYTEQGGLIRRQQALLPMRVIMDARRRHQAFVEEQKRKDEEEKMLEQVRVEELLRMPTPEREEELGPIAYTKMESLEKLGQLKKTAVLEPPATAGVSGELESAQRIMKNVLIPGALQPASNSSGRDSFIAAESRLSNESMVHDRKIEEQKEPSVFSFPSVSGLSILNELEKAFEEGRSESSSSPATAPVPSNDVSYSLPTSPDQHMQRVEQNITEKNTSVLIEDEQAAPERAHILADSNIVPVQSVVKDSLIKSPDATLLAVPQENASSVEPVKNGVRGEQKKLVPQPPVAPPSHIAPTKHCVLFSVEVARLSEFLVQVDNWFDYELRLKIKEDRCVLELIVPKGDLATVSPIISVFKIGGVTMKPFKG